MRPGLAGFLATLTACTALGVAAASARAGDESPAAPTADARPSVEASLDLLRSPLFTERENAVADLIAAGSTARAAVLKAFRESGLVERPLLVRVLAADASQEALDALLEALPESKDAATTFAIQMSLVEHAERIGDAVRTWHGGKAPPRVAELAELLDRARIERRFLAKKSASGGTGSYPGQFEDLDNDQDRQLALDVCLGVLSNRAPRLPGRYPTGAYRFLRAPSFFVSNDELRQMSIHAISELARPTDTRVLADLVALRIELENVVARLNRQQAAVEASLADSILATLAKLRPDDAAKLSRSEARDAGRDTWLGFANDKIEQLRQNDYWLDDAASLALQLHDFEKAVELYRELVFPPIRSALRGEGGAISAYNLACAYARWSLEPGRQPVATLRMKALDAIELSQKRGYPDWSWMEQDRDLDPIRAEPRFRLLVERMKAAFSPRKSRPAGPGGAPPTPAMDR